ncbi:Dna helicase PSH3 [Cardiosporidium cionae]|uniref:Dna helicase PSH3 n=1 Tax=Cardiosporidium cionae TaxID=476202 RepID=A0ABQ7JG58_9APIC|nr:Dna helicase PSH3 [Cardiosporidium cionae]|eukprot:KAF8822948.1 Dna helicase PSH3 [Cardiosporidium cionae]
MGGISVVEDRKQLNAWPTIIVSTPGRLRNAMRRHSIFRAKRRRLIAFVLDEADLLLSHCFRECIEKLGFFLPTQPRMEDFSMDGRLDSMDFHRSLLMKWIRPSVQLLAFSATFPKPFISYFEDFILNLDFIQAMAAPSTTDSKLPLIEGGNFMPNIGEALPDPSSVDFSFNVNSPMELPPGCFLQREFVKILLCSSHWQPSTHIQSTSSFNKDHPPLTSPLKTDAEAEKGDFSLQTSSCDKAKPSYSSPSVETSDVFSSLTKRSFASPVLFGILSLPCKDFSFPYYVDKEGLKFCCISLPSSPSDFEEFRSSNGMQLAKSFSNAGIPTDYTRSSFLDAYLLILFYFCFNLSRLSQADRVESFSSLKYGRCRVLVCSDVMSRGVDAPTVDLVLNWDIPMDKETFLHRCGRAARFGQYGYNITICTEEDFSYANYFFLTFNIIPMPFEELVASIPAAQSVSGEDLTLLQSVCTPTVDFQRATEVSHISSRHMALQEEILGVTSEIKGEEIHENVSTDEKKVENTVPLPSVATVTNEISNSVEPVVIRQTVASSTPTYQGGNESVREALSPPQNFPLKDCMYIPLMGFFAGSHMFAHSNMENTALSYIEEVLKNEIKWKSAPSHTFTSVNTPSNILEVDPTQPETELHETVTTGPVKSSLFLEVRRKYPAKPTFGEFSSTSTVGNSAEFQIRLVLRRPADFLSKISHPPIALLSSVDLPSNAIRLLEGAGEAASPKAHVHNASTAYIYFSLLNVRAASSTVCIPFSDTLGSAGTRIAFPVNGIVCSTTHGCSNLFCNFMQSHDVSLATVTMDVFLYTLEKFESSLWCSFKRQCEQLVEAEFPPPGVARKRRESIPSDLRCVGNPLFALRTAPNAWLKEVRGYHAAIWNA